MENDLIENIDFTFDKKGRMVFTKAYHLKRGYCCSNNCKHCPWKKTNKDATTTLKNKLK